LSIHFFFYFCLSLTTADEGENEEVVSCRSKERKKERKKKVFYSSVVISFSSHLDFVARDASLTYMILPPTSEKLSLLLILFLDYTLI
jgi:hypothetical protein